MAQGVCELVWIKLLLSDLGIDQTDSMWIYCDNNAAINIAHNPVQHDMTKHVEIDRHFIKEKLTSAQYFGEQLADILTKGVRSKPLHDILGKLGYLRKKNLQASRHQVYFGLHPYTVGTASGISIRERTTEEFAVPIINRENAEPNPPSTAVSNSEEIHMVDEVDHPFILSGDREIPFTYLASLSAKWAAVKDNAPNVQGKIKVVQNGIGHSPEEVTTALASSDTKRGTMLMQISEASPLPIAIEMNQGYALQVRGNLGPMKRGTVVQ
ncbi:hypothetical protein HYC85_004513 [Camellia sinensis]|uniref:Reverse transcriptase Ty1/copia-type domain-containing protein n=1 Tax=Camellia sinensis TaxID=4442 RepID=A0A7J7HZG8_CAMSI|nr:hypothetical protein HYC85_004513 [Camellia sinensis]